MNNICNISYTQSWVYKIVKSKKVRKWVTNDQEVSRNSIRPTHILIIKTLDWILPDNGHGQSSRAHVTVFGGRGSKSLWKKEIIYFASISKTIVSCLKFSVITSPWSPDINSSGGKSDRFDFDTFEEVQV